MSEPKIRWRGRPHHHLPRIRTSSSRHSILSNTVAHLAAEEVTHLPFGKALEQARMQQRLKGWRRKGIGCRGSTKKHTGQSSSVATFTETTQSDNSCSLAMEKVPSVNPRLNHLGSRQPSHNQIYEASAVTGAESSRTIRHQRAGNDSPEYSLMQVSEPSVSGTMQTVGNGDIGQQGKSRRRIAAEYAHVGPIDGVRKASTHSSTIVGKSRTYNPSANSSLAQQNRRPTKSTFSNYRRSVTSGRTSVLHGPGSLRSKRSGHSTQAFWHAISSSNPWMDSGMFASSPISEAPRRSSSKRNSFRRFVHELKGHLVSQEALRKASLATSLASSPSCVSARTIAEFMPYMAEFHAAGLAVTSKDQKVGIRSKARNFSPSSVPPKYAASSAAVSSGTGEDGTDDARDRSPLDREALATFSSDTTGTTIVSFAPVQEDQTARRPLQPEPPKLNTKSTLPWLRKQSRVPVSSQNVTPLPERNPSLSTTSTRTTIIDFDPHPSDFKSALERSEKDSSSDEEPSEIKWTDTVQSPSRKPVAGLSEASGAAPAEHQDLGDDIPTGGIIKTLPTRSHPRAADDLRKQERTGSIVSSTRNVKDSPKAFNRYGAVKFASLGPRASPRILERQKTWARDDDEGAISGKDLQGPTEAVEATPSRQNSSQLPSSVPLSPSCGQCGSILTKFNTNSSESKKFVKSGTAEPPVRCSDCIPSRKTTDIPHRASQTTDFSRSRGSTFDHRDQLLPSALEEALSEIGSRAETSEPSLGEANVTTNFLGEQRKNAPLGDPVKRPSRPDSDAPTPRNDLEDPGHSTTSEISDLDIMKGLQIALVAACDPQIDEWIREVSGTSVRSFLAELKSFEGLGVNGLLHSARKSSLLREQEFRRLSGLKHAREKSGLGKHDGGDDDGLAKSGTKNKSVGSGQTVADIDTSLNGDLTGRHQGRDAPKSRKDHRTWTGTIGPR